MFGTIGHARLKAGSERAVQGLLEEWQREIRPRVPGAFVSLGGHVAGDPQALVFLALAQDEATYRALAELPEQDAWYRRFAEHVEGEVGWEDVEMEEAGQMDRLWA
jgi:hypothetical protein